MKNINFNISKKHFKVNDEDYNEIISNYIKDEVYHIITINIIEMCTMHDEIYKLLRT